MSTWVDDDANVNILVDILRIDRQKYVDNTALYGVYRMSSWKLTHIWYTEAIKESRRRPSEDSNCNSPSSSKESLDEEVPIHIFSSSSWAECVFRSSLSFSTGNIPKLGWSWEDMSKDKYSSRNKCRRQTPRQRWTLKFERRAFLNWKLNGLVKQGY